MEFYKGSLDEVSERDVKAFGYYQGLYKAAGKAEPGGCAPLY